MLLAMAYAWRVLCVLWCQELVELRRSGVVVRQRSLALHLSVPAMGESMSGAQSCNVAITVICAHAVHAEAN